jgi:6-pyruvoyltetrahydropterin/6-carboxytetrahydropterin synthase
VRVELSRDFRFEAAHLLPAAPEGHKCQRLHGHSFRFSVEVSGEVDPVAGWLVDFAVIQAAVEPVRKRLDHDYLNQIEGLANPTSENLARWLWERIAPSLPGLSAITVEETCNSRCTYRGGG